MPETAINKPFDAEEIRSIAVAEFTRRLDQLSPLQGSKEYAWFRLDYQVNIALRRTGEQGGEEKNTLAWGVLEQSSDSPSVSEVESESTSASVVSKDPNQERLDRDMPLTVEMSDGRGGRKHEKRRIRK
jgi:hypothetical protein